MNKVVDRLASQAHAYADKHTRDGDDRYGIVKIEYFTKLLLKECAEILNTNYPPDDCLPIEEVIGCLNEHFGITNE